MLNRVILMGRITQDLELKQTPSGASVLAFNIAVDRGYVKQGEERQADFITCVAWNQRAEFINNYFSKGRMIAVEGSLRTRTYDDKNGSRHYVTEVYVDNTSFTGEPKQSGSQTTYSAPVQNAPAPQQSYAQSEPNTETVAIGDISDFEEILSDDGLPF